MDRSRSKSMRRVGAEKAQQTSTSQEARQIVLQASFNIFIAVQKVFNTSDTLLRQRN